MSPRTLPSAHALTRGQRDGTHCVWCGRQLGEHSVSAGIARGYLGAHDRSISVWACPTCPTKQTGL